jgi:hydroxymethylglutaryl-CoA synthase
VAQQQGGRGRGESAVPARDENHVTMASEAGEEALARSALEPADLGAVVSASISDYFAEHGVAAPVAYRLGATGDVRTADFRSTGRAAADALALARSVVESSGEPTLVVAADVMPAEPGGDDEASAGAGAGAVVLRPDAEAPAARFTGHGTETTGFVERHREHGGQVQPGDDSFEREFGVDPAASAAIERATTDAGGQPDLAVASAPGYRMAKTALSGVDADWISTFNQVGYAGAATLLLDLAHALESADAGADLLAVAYGQGGADAFTLEAGSGAGADVGLPVAEQLEAKEYVPYAKHLAYRENVDYEGVPSP